MFNLYGILILIGIIIIIAVLIVKKLLRIALLVSGITIAILLFLWLWSPQSPLPLTKKTPSMNDMATILSTYATSTALTPKAQGKIFCESYPFYQEQESAQKINFYAWLTCKEFYKNGTSLAQGESLSNAGRFTLEERNPQEWLVAKVTFTKSGVLFEKSVEDLFPKDFVQQVTQEKTFREGLDKKVRDKALTYFNIKE